MIFTCKSCGGNVVFDPALQTMHCHFCDGKDTEVIKKNPGMEVCLNCGAELQPGQFISATMCEHCGSSVVFDPRVEGKYQPNHILPFKITKESAKERIVQLIRKRIFTPDFFLNEGNLSRIKGMYVPFWMYDYYASLVFQGKGTKVKSWTAGNYHYTETSIYQVVRDMSMKFEDIPADASVDLDDVHMDLLEPYAYQELVEFQEKFMSGFEASIYSVEEADMEPRIKERIRKDTELLLKNSITGYAAITTDHKQLDLEKDEVEYALLPIYYYSCRFLDKNYDFFVNGQTGKVVGKTPISAMKLFAYAGTMVSGLLLCSVLFLKILEVIL